MWQAHVQDSGYSNFQDCGYTNICVIVVTLLQACGYTVVPRGEGWLPTWYQIPPPWGNHHMQDLALSEHFSIFFFVITLVWLFFTYCTRLYSEWENFCEDVLTVTVLTIFLLYLCTYIWVFVCFSFVLYSYTIFKGTVAWDFRPVFWPGWMHLGLNVNRFCF